MRRMLKQDARIVFAFILTGIIPLFSCGGCASRYQMAAERALYAREYRILEDELYHAHHEINRLARINEQLYRNTHGEDSGGNFESDSYTPKSKRSRESAVPTIAPIPLEGLEPSQGIPDILKRSSSMKGSNPGNFRVARSHPPVRTHYPPSRNTTSHPVAVQPLPRSMEQAAYNNGAHHETAPQRSIPEFTPRPSKPSGPVNLEDHTDFEEQQLLLWAPHR